MAAASIMGLFSKHNECPHSTDMVYHSSNTSSVSFGPKSACGVQIFVSAGLPIASRPQTIRLLLLGLNIQVSD